MSETLQYSNTDLEPRTRARDATNTILGELACTFDVNSSDELREKVLSDPDALKDFLCFVNSCLTREDKVTPNSEATSFMGSTYEGKQTVGIRMLAPSYRDKFMTEATKLIATAKETTVAANLLALAIVLAHSFGDGNGRTARVVRQMLMGAGGPGWPMDNVIHAAISREHQVRREVSILPMDELKRAWIGDELDKDASGEIRDKFRSIHVRLKSEEFSFEAKGLTYIDGEKVSEKLTGIVDGTVKKLFAQVIQQEGFGALALAQCGINLENLSTIDDDLAKNIIEKDNDNKYAYSLCAMYTAAGREQLRYRTKYDAPPVIINGSPIFLDKTSIAGWD